ncbi:MAG: L,D-transpeptidase [Anaerolineaceae bacterium]|nr:L,D-transpeptidase [Anaerolineaceae bacterium]
MQDLKQSAKKISRREFLKLSGISLVSVALSSSYTQLNPGNPFIKDKSNFSPSKYGRVISNHLWTFDYPSLSANPLERLKRDAVLPITNSLIGQEEPTYNRLWYEIDGNGYAHSGMIQPVDTKLNIPESSMDGKGFLVETSVPYTDAIWDPKWGRTTAYRVYHGTTFWVDRIVKDDFGKTWYRFLDDQWNYHYYGDAVHFRKITLDEIAPLSPDVPGEDKRIEVRLSSQIVIAFEYNKPIYMTRAATGAKFSTGNFSTPLGIFITNRKRPSRHMTDGSSYDLPGIPWVCYLNERGVSFHGTFWHNDFGKPRSHGCINLPTEGAKWLYRWTQPDVPLNENYWAQDFGTRVDVI